MPNGAFGYDVIGLAHRQPRRTLERKLAPAEESEA